MKIWPEKTQDLEFKDLGDLGFDGSLNDRQFKYLRGEGYTGALNDMLYSLRGGGVAFGLTDNPFDNFPKRVEQNLTTVNVRLSGTGTESGYDARILNAADDTEVVTWTALSNFTATGGNWSGTIPMTGGKLRYKAQVRNAAGDILTQSKTFITSGVVGGIGQSNLNGFFNAGLVGQPASSTNVFVLKGGVISNPSQGAGDGFGLVTLLNALEAETDICWVATKGAANGVSISSLDDDIDNEFDSTFAWDELTGQLDIIGDRPNLMMFNQGEGNSFSGGTGLDTYKAQFAEIFDDLEAKYPVSPSAKIPVFITSLGTVASGDYADGYSLVDDIHKELVAENAHYLWGGSGKDAHRIDTFHFDAQSYSRRGARLARHILAYYGVVSSFTEFRISAVNAIDLTTTDVTVAHGEGTGMAIREVQFDDPAAGANTTVVRGFEIGVGGAGYVAATGSIEDATTIRLTHASTQGLGRTLNHIYAGDADVTGLVVDNSDEAVPLLHAGNLEVTPFSGAKGIVSQNTIYINETTATSFTHPDGLALSSRTRNIYMIAATNERTISSCTVNGVGVNLISNTTFNNIRYYVFDTAQTGDLEYTLSGASRSYVWHVGCTGTTGAAASLDIQEVLASGSTPLTATHTAQTRSQFDLYIGFVEGANSVNDISSYVFDSEKQNFFGTFGAVRGIIGPMQASDGTSKIFEITTGGFPARLRSHLLAITADTV